MECRHLLWRIFVANPEKRITIREMTSHPWFLKNLPTELMDGASWQKTGGINQPSQSTEEILSLIQEARKPPEQPRLAGPLLSGSMDLDDLDDVDADLEDLGANGDFVLPK
ncbi:hypothetical protein Droror1_Dr00000309 [Drosera rotundifolia]